MYVEDLVDFILFALKNYDKIEHIMNVGLGYDYSINEYYNAVAEVVGYTGDFEYDLTKPSGMKRKLCDVTKQNKIGWNPKNSLTECLQKTYQYYLDTYEI
jgi:GDP-L-fucose synthase